MTNSTTDPQNELLTQVDENNQIISSISRKEAHHKQGVFYRTIFVIVKNERDQILLQKRSSTKDLYPNCWDLSVGGHVEFGDSYEQTAIRELEEELGIKAKVNDLIQKGHVLVKLPNSGEHFMVFEYQLKPDQKIMVSKEEINHIKWMSIDEIKASMKNSSMQWYERPLQTIAALY